MKGLLFWAWGGHVGIKKFLEKKWATPNGAISLRTVCRQPRRTPPPRSHPHLAPRPPTRQSRKLIRTKTPINNQLPNPIQLLVNNWLRCSQKMPRTSRASRGGYVCPVLNRGNRRNDVIQQKIQYFSSKENSCARLFLITFMAKPWVCLQVK